MVKLINKKSKHQKITDDLESRLQCKPYVSFICKNDEYIKGECDVLSVQDNKVVYYEVKSRYTPKSLKHAREQLLRWSRYMKKHHKLGTFYGVYATPEIIKVICKNGYVLCGGHYDTR